MIRNVKLNIKNSKSIYIWLLEMYGKRIGHQQFTTWDHVFDRVEKFRYADSEITHSYNTTIPPVKESRDISANRSYFG